MYSNCRCKKYGTGFTSRKRIYFIRLDKKGRLVLPLEIRDKLTIPTNGSVLIKVLASDSATVTVSLSKPSDADTANSIPFSKNGKYVKRRVELW